MPSKPPKVAPGAEVLGPRFRIQHQGQSTAPGSRLAVCSPSQGAVLAPSVTFSKDWFPRPGRIRIADPPRNRVGQRGCKPSISRMAVHQSSYSKSRTLRRQEIRDELRMEKDPGSLREKRNTRTRMHTHTRAHTRTHQRSVPEDGFLGSTFGFKSIHSSFTPWLS